MRDKPGGSVVKKLSAHAGDVRDKSSIPGSRPFPWVGVWRQLLSAQRGHWLRA